MTKLTNRRAENSTGSGFQSVIRTLGYRNFRLFFGGQGLSLIGTWMQQVAMAWLVYRLTGSAFMLGLVNFCARIPIFLTSPFLGVLADRWNRHRILLFTQTFSMLQALLLAALVLSHRVQVWHLFALSLFIGIINAMDIPARQSFLIEMVEKKEDLGSAIALNSSLVNGARLIGPSVAGILIAAAGEGVCFLINGLSYLAVIAALLLMRITPRRPEPRTSSILQQFREGALYAYGFAPIRAILLLVSLVSLMGLPYMVLMPIFAKDIFHQGAHGLGFLTGAAGVGSLVGALFLAGRTSVLGLGRTIVSATFLFGASLLAFSHFPFFWPALGLLTLTGFGMIVLLASANTVLQTIVEDNKRGRLMSFYAMSFGGMVPFGSLVAGGLATTIGAQNTVLAGGLVCIAGGLWFARSLPRLRSMVHPIYVQKGILPEVAVGIQSATEQAGQPKINGF
ncbi:MAG: MFS transporter [Deltaproteobacteria bacterium]